MPTCGSTSNESAGGSVVAGVEEVEGVEASEVVDGIDEVGGVVGRGAVVDVLLRWVAGAEQPSLTSATVAKTMTAHATSDALSGKWIILGDGGDQLASWTTVASPTLA
jgi:hypothetical protein